MTSLQLKGNCLKEAEEFLPLVQCKNLEFLDIESNPITGSTEEVLVVYERLIKGCARGFWVTWNETTRRTSMGGKKFTRPKSFHFETRRSLISNRNSSCSSCSRTSLDSKNFEVKKPKKLYDLFRKVGLTSGGGTAHEKSRSSFTEHIKAVKFGRTYGPILSARHRVSFQDIPIKGPIMIACRKVSVKTADRMPESEIQKPMVMKSARISPRVIPKNNGFDSLKNYFNRNVTPKPDRRILYQKKSITSIFDKRDQPNKEILILNRRRMNVANRYDEDMPITPAEPEASSDSPTLKKFC